MGNEVVLKNIPRYFKKKWEKENWEEYHNWRFKKIQESEINQQKEIEKYSLPEDWSIDKKLKFILEQKEQQLFNKLKQSGSLFRGLADEIFIDK